MGLSNGVDLLAVRDAGADEIDAPMRMPEPAAATAPVGRAAARVAG